MIKKSSEERKVEFFNSLPSEQREELKIYLDYFQKQKDKLKLIEDDRYLHPTIISRFVDDIHENFMMYNKMSDKQIYFFIAGCKKHEELNLRNETCWEYSTDDKVSTNGTMVGKYTNSYGYTMFVADNQKTGHTYKWAINPANEKKKEFLEQCEKFLTDKSVIEIRGIVKYVDSKNKSVIVLKSTSTLSIKLKGQK